MPRKTSNKKVAVPLKIGDLTALRKIQFNVPTSGSSSVTQAMKNKKGVTTDYKLQFSDGKLKSIKPVKNAFKGKIPESFIKKRNIEIKKSREKRKIKKKLKVKKFA